MSLERRIIERIGRHLAHPDVLAHDAYYDPDSRAIYTTDMMVAGRHFRLDYCAPEDIGWKAGAVNISDIAATGGRLRYLLVSLGLPDQLDMAFIDGFYAGLAEVSRMFDGAIVGGDTVGGDALTVNVTAIGELPARHTPGRRDTARAGDWLVATGCHGLSHVGLRALQEGLSGYKAAKQAHRRPIPRVAEGLWLSGHFRRYALMDSSDGLADALIKLAEASGLRLVVEADSLPVHADVRKMDKEAALDTVLYGGEDFELVAAVPAADNLPPAFAVVGRALPAAPDKPAGAYLNRGGRLEPLLLERTYQHFGGSV